MRRGGAKSCKIGLGRDNEIYFGRFITTNFRVGLGRRNKELNEFPWGARDWGASTVAHFARKVRGTDMSRTCLKYIVDYIVDYAAPPPLKGAHIPG